MAKGFGPAVAGSFRTAGPAIASSRGGISPLAVKSSFSPTGPEHGTPISISPREAKVSDPRPNLFNAFLKSLVPIVRPDQIDVGNIEARNSAQSVKVLGNLEAFSGMKPAPRAGALAEPVLVPNEAVANVVGYKPIPKKSPTEINPALRQSRARILSIGGARTEASSTSNVVNLRSPNVDIETRRSESVINSPERSKIQFEQITLSRIRRNLDFLRAIKAQSVSAPAIQEQVAVLTQAVTEQKSETSSQFSSIARTLTKPEILRGAVRTARADPDYAGTSVVNNSEEDLKKKYVGTDEEVNAERRRTLREAYARIKAENPSEGVEGKRLVAVSEIFAKYLRSRLLAQIGLEEQEDGGQYGIAENLRANNNVVAGDLEGVVESNTALVRTLRAPRKLAARRELTRVFTLPEKPVTIVPVEIVEQEVEIKTAEKKIVGFADYAKSASLIKPKEESLAGVNTKNEQILSDISAFSSRLFDKRAYSVLPEPWESILRKAA